MGALDIALYHILFSNTAYDRCFLFFKCFCIRQALDFRADKVQIVRGADA